jgi:uncharacterized protein (DUF433 family)
MDRLWTIREAAAIADLSAKTIRAMIEREGLRPASTGEGGKRTGHLFSLRDLMYLKLRAEFPFALRKADKAALEGLVRGRRAMVSGWRAAGEELVLQTDKVTVHVDFARLRDTLTRNANAFEWGQQRIVSDRAVLNGEPVFRGTHIPLKDVAGLVRQGFSDIELAERFPVLNPSDLDFARIHARLGKRPGRPRKPLELPRTAEAA